MSVLLCQSSSISDEKLINRPSTVHYMYISAFTEKMTSPYNCAWNVEFSVSQDDTLHIHNEN